MCSLSLNIVTILLKKNQEFHTIEKIKNLAKKKLKFQQNVQLKVTFTHYLISHFQVHVHSNLMLLTKRLPPIMVDYIQDHRHHNQFL